VDRNGRGYSNTPNITVREHLTRRASRHVTGEETCTNNQAQLRPLEHSTLQEMSRETFRESVIEQVGRLAESIDMPQQPVRDSQCSADRHSLARISHDKLKIKS
jgi:hypothetical protein